MPELSGVTVLSNLVSGRLFYFDPLSAVSAEPSILRELALSFDGVDTTLAQLDGDSFFGGRTGLHLDSDGNGELYLLSKGFGNICRLGSLTAVPEPSAGMMLIAGFGLIGSSLRRRRRTLAAAT